MRNQLRDKLLTFIYTIEVNSLTLELIRQFSNHETVELHQALKERVIALGDSIEIRPRKLYIGFVAGTNFVDVHPQRMQLKLWINLPRGELDDPKNMARDVSEVGHWGNGDYQVYIESNDDLDYLMTLIKQSYSKHS